MGKLILAIVMFTTSSIDKSAFLVIYDKVMKQAPYLGWPYLGCQFVIYDQSHNTFFI